MEVTKLGEDGNMVMVLVSQPGLPTRYRNLSLLFPAPDCAEPERGEKLRSSIQKSLIYAESTTKKAKKGTFLLKRKADASVYATNKKIS